MGSSSEQPSSLVCILASELYPKKNLCSDDQFVQVPFPELCGESVQYLGHATTDSVVAISNFRFFVRFKDSFINVPIGLIESVECRDIFYLYINCKDARSYRISFDSGEQCLEWWKRLLDVLTPPTDLDQVFAFAYHAWCIDSSLSVHGEESTHLCHPDGSMQYSFLEEVKRMGFDRQSSWRISDINSDYGLCPTYPKLHIVPARITDSELERIAAFRSDGRFPSVVYRHRSNGAIISRCSQPSVGWLGWRSTEDENYIQALQMACSKDFSSESFHSCQDKLSLSADSGQEQLAPHLDSGQSTPEQVQEGTESTEDVQSEDQGMLILDARSYTAAVANRAKGGGCECAEYYPHCEVQFMSLGNIHAIRKSFQALRSLCSQSSDTANWLSTLENTKWLYHLSMLIRSSMIIVDAVHRESRPVLVHCSDGWDRTPQIVSLAEIMLDPYYRTIKGFQVLIEREWLEFGHRFADRCGQGSDSDDPNQRCPVFLQWLDCIHQLIRQFPCSFEFNETYLVKLLQHSYLCLFGTFLCNNEKERSEHKVKSKTCSVWSSLKPTRREFRNYLYSPDSVQVLEPSYHIRSLLVWSAAYMANSSVSVTTAVNDISATSDYEETSTCTTPTSVSGSGSEHMHSKDISASHSYIRDCKLHQKVQNGATKLQHYVSKCPHCYTGTKHQSLLHMDLEYSHSTSTNYSEQISTSEAGERPDFEGLMRSSSCPGNLNTSMSSSTVTIIPDSAVNDTEEYIYNGTPSATSQSEATSANSISNDQIDYSCENGHVDNDNPNKDIRKDCADERTSDQNSADQIVPEVNSEQISSAYTPSHDGKVHDNYDSFKSCLSELPRTEKTVGSEPKSSSSSDFLNASVMCRYLDNDGLTSTHDSVHSRIQQIEASYQAAIDNLQAQLQAERLCRRLNTVSDRDVEYPLHGRVVDCDEVVSLPDSSHGEPHSLSSTSTDDSSWEQVEEGDTQVTRWVPDHAVTNCSKCKVQFWVINRKHHCRNCGGVFCSSCSGHTIPVPEEQLYDPVRVCVFCYDKLAVQDDDMGRLQRLSLTSN